MRQVAIAEVMDDGAIIPVTVLRALGVARGDTVAFVVRDDGSTSLMGVRDASPVPGRIRDIVGVFSTGAPRTPADDATFLREVRYSDEPDDNWDARDVR